MQIHYSIFTFKRENRDILKVIKKVEEEFFLAA
jgi:hypothetical protein